MGFAHPSTGGDGFEADRSHLMQSYLLRCGRFASRLTGIEPYACPLLEYGKTIACVPPLLLLAAFESFGATCEENLFFTTFAITVV